MVSRPSKTGAKTVLRRRLLGPGWGRGKGASVNWAAPVWPWVRTLDELVTALERELNQRRFVPTGGPLFEEAAFYGASSLVNIGPEGNPTIPLASVRKALDTCGTKGWARVGGSALVSLEAIDKKASDLESRGEVDFRPLYPGPDAWGNRSRWIWGDYTDDQLLRRTRQVYDAALRGYQQLVEGWFGPLAPWLPLSAALPARLAGKFRPMVGDNLTDQPVLVTSFEPLPPSEASAVDIQMDHQGNWKETDFDDTAWWNRFQALRSGSVADLPVMRCMSSVKVFGDSPARELAYDWLKSDLLSVSWSA